MFERAPSLHCFNRLVNSVILRSLEILASYEKQISNVLVVTLEELNSYEIKISLEIFISYVKWIANEKSATL